FIGVIGISILVNMGTNIFMGEISFVSQTTAAALQLAVSMDYSIFLLHTFAIHRDKGKEPVEAMQAAIKQARPSILASAATTFCGFLALTIMRFGIGADLGIVLAKGVFVSLVTVLFLLPVATIMCCGLLEKFQHRALMPSFKGFANVVVKIGVPVTIILVLLIVPAYLAQSKNTFVYMASETNDDTIAIQERFGSGEQLFVLVPEGNHLKEMNLAQDLADLPQIDSVTSRASSVGFEIPFESLPKDTRDLLQSGGYSRMIISAEEIGFSLVAQIRTLVEASYGQSYHLGGTAASLSDMKDTLSEDNKLTGLVSILAISLIVLLTFRSPVLLILLVGAIEVSIWINLSVPYFTGNDVTFFGYMIISSVQLGATVDYAILFGSRYLEKRRTIGKLEAAKESLSETTGSILTSALILFGAGMIISTISMDEMASELGDLLGRGALLSAAMVLVILPNAFRLCDGAIRRLTFKSNFLEDKLQ
ncbi:MAG: MMPL family transporter, partial [Clostridiales bacterium]|nr:MMPL family transporter [Clostridiales bacterium]